MIFKLKQYRNAGATTLFVATAIVPLLIFLLSVSLDVSRYYAEAEKWQTVLDEGASYAQRFLPYQVDSLSAAQAFLARYGISPTDTEVFVDGDSVSIKMNKGMELSFAKYFGLSASVPLGVYSRARGLPFDSLIVLDASSYLAPNLLGGSAWGDSLSWPASSFFEFDQPLYEGAGPLDPRLVTQQCFNPNFNALKLAAAQAYEYMAGFSKNAVGLGVYPGYGAYFDSIRDVVGAGTRRYGPGEVDFNFYAAAHNRNVLCAAAAERELNSAQYQFPLGNVAIEGQSQPVLPVPIIFPGADPYSYALNSSYIPYLRGREVLWSQAAHEGQIGDFVQVLREVRSRLMGSSPTTGRGGLVNVAGKSAFVFAGDVPWTQGSRFPDGIVQASLQTQLSALKGDLAQLANAASFKLSYVLFPHPGNATADFQSRVAEFSTFLRDQQLIDGSESSRFKLELVFLPSASFLAQMGIGNLILSKQTAVLSR